MYGVKTKIMQKKEISSAPRPPTFESPKLKATQNTTWARDDEYEPYTKAPYNKTPEEFISTHINNQLPTGKKMPKHPLLVISYPPSFSGDPNPDYSQHLIQTTSLQSPQNKPNIYTSSPNHLAPPISPPQTKHTNQYLTPTSMLTLTSGT